MSTNNEKSLTTVTEEMLPTLLDQELNNMMQMDGFDYRPGKIGIMHREKKFVGTDGQTSSSIKGVVVYFHKARGYWQEEGQQIPTCSSMDGKTGSLRLDNDTTEQRTCVKCPYNVFGSDPKGGAGKACKEMRRLFLVEEDSILPVILNIPPTSLRAFDQYMSGLLSKKKAPIAYYTVFRLEGAKGAGFDYSKVAFELGEQLPHAKILELLQMRDQVVAAAAKIGIEADDYMNEGETLSDDKEIY